MYLFVIGTRPEAIKLWQVYVACQGKNIPVKVVATGQQPIGHILSQLKIQCDYSWMSSDSSDNIGRLAQYAEGLRQLAEQHSAAIVVQGDTLSALAGALGGFYAQRPVYHVEAGLRTDDLSSPFPEEGHRRMIAQVATGNFAPTRQDRQALLNENVPGDIWVTGNPVIDAVRVVSETIAPTIPLVFQSILDRDSPLVLVTGHRHENRSAALQKILSALERVIERVPGISICWVRHPNPAVAPFLAEYSGPVRIVPAMDYFTFLAVLRQAKLVVTDSGGLQEECTFLQVPMVVCRKRTERKALPGITGFNLSGTINANTIENMVVAALQSGSRPNSPFLFGDGHAGTKIAEILEDACA